MAGRRGLVMAALCAACVAGAMFVSGLPGGLWVSASRAPVPPPTAPPAPAEPLPVVHPSEVAMDRARALRADGRLRDAVRALDEVRLADPARAQADQLRADIQEDIFVAAGMSGSFPADVRGRP